MNCLRTLRFDSYPEFEMAAQRQEETISKGKEVVAK